MADRRTLTIAELVDEATRRFGDDQMTWAFRCPNCGDVATPADFPEDMRDRIGQECIGRHRGALEGSAHDSRGLADAPARETVDV